MIKLSPLILVGGTITSALGIGYGVHQTTSSAPVPRAQIAQQTPAPQLDGPRLALTDITFTIAAPDMETRPIDPVARPSVPQPMIAATPDRGAAETGGDQEDAAATCEPAFSATAEPAAMVRLDLSGPCLKGQTVTIHHNGMMFSHNVGQDGEASISAPALAEQAIYIVSFGDGNGAVAQTKVPDLSAHERIVLQWQGDDGLQLHAFENGASYGDDGHIWTDAAGDPDHALSGLSGFLRHYGDASGPDGLRADVYTFAKGVQLSADTVQINAEVEVTESNCGYEVAGQMLRLAKDATLKSHDLSMAMPDCDATGSFLVLKNLLQDLKIARN
ncbi:hypothetical protein [Sediminimonas qiaohouensis]|nr:hypothetical protein [Sediminimonas qiaohouensis]